MCSVEEKKSIDQIIDNGPCLAGELDFNVLHGRHSLSLTTLYTGTDAHTMMPTVAICVQL